MVISYFVALPKLPQAKQCINNTEIISIFAIYGNESLNI